MESIQVFNNPEFGSIRMIIINDEPWFVAKDVSEKLGYTRTSSMTKQIDDDDRQIFDCTSQAHTNFSTKARNIGIINESGLYSAIMGSQLKNAKAFKRWVTKDILPSIRKTGTYGQPQLPAEPMEMLKIHYAALEQVDKKVSDVDEKIEILEQRFNKFEDELPVTGADIDNIQSAVRKKGIQSLGGKQSNAYKDISTRAFVYADIQCELRRQFGVKRYREIKHKDAPDAIKIIVDYKLPIALKNRVDMVNAQQSLDLERGA